MTRSIPNFVCLGCECRCDDLRADIENNSMLLSGGCSLSEKWIGKSTPSHPAYLNGQPASVEAVIGWAIETLSQSQQPLFTGMNELTTETQQAFISLALSVSGMMDTNFSSTSRGGTIAMQRHGLATASLGEVRQRGDVVVFWFCDPMRTHPRFVERFCKSAQQIIVVDDGDNETAASADRFIQVSQAEALSALSHMRLRLGTPARIEEPYPSELCELYQSFVGAQYAVSCFGSSGVDAAFDPLVDSLIQFVRQLNDKTRSVAIGLRQDGNAISAENVATWMTGAPFGIRTNGGRYEYSWTRISYSIAHSNACDLIIAGGFPNGPSAVQLKPPVDIPLFGLVSDAEQEQTALDWQADAILAVARPGISESGSFCRLDDVSLPVGAPLSSEFPTASDVLKKLAQLPPS